MKNSLVLWFLVVMSWGAFSQSNTSFILEDSPIETTPKDTVRNKSRIFTEIDFGTSIIGSGNNHYSFSTYIHPKISYELTPRFHVSMGLMAVRSNLNAYTYYNYEGLAQDVNYKGVSAYYTLQGSYLLTENLKIYGGVMLGSHFPDMNSKSNNLIKNPKAYQLGMQYKFGDFSLGFEFIYQESDFGGDFFEQGNHRMMHNSLMRNHPF